MPGSDPITVALIEDEHAIRKGLSVLLDGTPGYRCVGTFGSVEEALRAMRSEAPNVLLLDINLPGMSGAEGARFLKEKYPSTKILMLTVYDEEEKIFESVCNGAVGYLLKRTPRPSCSKLSENSMRVARRCRRRWRAKWCNSFSSPLRPGKPPIILRRTRSRF